MDAILVFSQLINIKNKLIRCHYSCFLDWSFYFLVSKPYTDVCSLLRTLLTPKNKFDLAGLVGKLKREILKQKVGFAIRVELFKYFSNLFTAVPFVLKEKA